MTVEDSHSDELTVVQFQDVNEDRNTQLIADGGREAKLIEAPDGDLLGYQCPACGTIKITEAKATTHCSNNTVSNHDHGTHMSSHQPKISENKNFTGIDFTNPENGVWAENRIARKQWMGHVNKRPFAPWSNTNHPEADVNKDARWKWSLSENYVDGEAIAMAEDDPRLEGRAFIQQEDDPFAFVDGDDVLDPETGEPHPAFIALLNRLGFSYADVSQSNSGVHVSYRGEFPEGVKEASWQLDDEPWGVNEDLPSVEIYDGNHVCVDTGKHVPGTPPEAREWNDDALYDLLNENNQLPEPINHLHESRREFDLDGYEPDTTVSDETADDIRDVFAALDRLDARRVADRTIVASWNDDASTSDDVRAFSPIWGRNSNGTANIVDDRIWQDTGDEGGYGTPVVMALIDAGEISHRNASPRRVNGGLWWRGIEALRALGFDIPEYDGSTVNPADTGQQYDVETCVPPAYNPREFDREQRWDELQGERYTEWLDRNRPVMIWGDDAGSGKTTNAALGADARNRPHFMPFLSHEKAREFTADPATPDGYFHLKGGKQPRHDCCMDAKMIASENETAHCSTHGHPSDWPRMNPIYERGRDDDLRQRFETLVGVVSPRRALYILDEDGGLVDGNPWLDQFDGLENRERVVGVHEYQLLETAVGDRDVIVDETPRVLGSEQHIGVRELFRTKIRLETLADLSRPDDQKSENFRSLAAFAERLAHAVAAADANGDDHEAADECLTTVEPPALEWETRREVMDPMSGEYVERDDHAETLVQLKLDYNKATIRRIKNGEYDGAPFITDALLAAAGRAGLDDESVRRAIAAPPELESCPWCASPLDYANGTRYCSADGCSWDERDHSVTRRDGTGAPARAKAWVAVPRGRPATLLFKELPAASDLPENGPLVLDATATPEKVAAFYGIPVADVDVRGDELLDLDGKLNVTQVLDGQYHPGTIERDGNGGENLRERFQNTFDAAGEFYDCPLFARKKDHADLFDFPEHGDELPPGGARGLNRNESDAVVFAGAPHPDTTELHRDAELLAMGRDDIDVGGEEHSTRRGPDGDLAANPPVYRKLRYEDDNGDGLAVPTKAFDELFGALFHEAREKEIEQFVHRIRPLLVEDGENPKDAYLLTNVPTDLPVDLVCSFEELADDLSAVFPVSDGALRLAGYGRDVLAGNGPDGFREGVLVEQRDDGTLANKAEGWHRLARLNGEDVTRRTIYNWLDALKAVGLLTSDEYEQQRGVSYTAEFSTLKSALQILSRNGSFEVAAVRRFAEKVRASDGSLDWLAWAKAVFGLSGDRCGWDPPPHTAN